MLWGKTEKSSPKKSVGIWLRVSRKTKRRVTAPNTTRGGLGYADSRDWHVAEVYHLEAVSGKSVMQHPEAERMLKDLRSGRITGLIFSKLARLARNTKDSSNSRIFSANVERI